MYKNIFHYENNLNYLFCFLEGKTLYSWFSSCLKEELSKDVPGKMKEQSALVIALLFYPRFR